MKKNKLTIEDIERKMKIMGGVEVNEKDFETGEEYKGISEYVKKIFGTSKVNRKSKLSKAKTG